MLNQFREEMMTTMRDRVRDARHVVRTIAHSDAREPGRFPVDPMRLFSGVARVSDRALTRAERLAIMLSPPPVQADFMPSPVFAPASWFAADADEGAVRFRRELYRLVKGIAARGGLADPLVHENRLAAARQAIRAELPDEIAAAGAGSIDAISAVAARTALVLKRERPLIGAERPGSLSHDVIYLVTGLAIASAWRADEEITVETLVASMTVTGQALHDEFGQAMRAAATEESLRAIYSRLAPHLP